MHDQDHSQQDFCQLVIHYYDIDYLYASSHNQVYQQPEWGRGQIQTVTGDRITVNFEHGGKQLIRNAAAVLVVVDLDAEAAEGVAVP